MSVLHFKAEEVLQMAERVEEAGIRFYRRGAEMQPELRELFLELAQMEEDHRRTFAEIRVSLTEGGRAILDEDTRAYLEAWTDSHLFSQDPADALQGLKTPQEVLKGAVALERDSIAFYVALEAVVPEGWGREKVREVIREEQRHFATLSQRLKALGG